MIYWYSFFAILIDDEKSVCNGPLRINRQFCIKLRAYNRYGWNDSLCSKTIILRKYMTLDQ